MSEAKARELGLQPLARFVASANAGVDPLFMGIGPVPATRKLFKRTGLGADDLDLIELNEAFAAQSLACIDELGLPMDRVNVNGGAIALGHPLGCSGAKLTTTLVHEMQRRDARYGLVSMCVGVGQGVSTLFERVS
jgi:acetyl-CoA acetyltransferase family protein